MDSNFLDQFPLPEVASQQLRQQQRTAQQLADGVVDFAGHDRGLAYRFFNHLEYNKSQSQILGYEKFDEVEMIEWLIDRKNKPCERVRLLPEELIRFDRDGEAVGGLYFESYKRFKEGLTAPGLSIAKWGVLADPEVATLSAHGIFSVEQFAAMPRSKIMGRFPQDIIDAFERAIQYVNGKDQRADNELAAQKVMELAQQNSKLESDVAELRQQLLDKTKGRKKVSEV